ncbi:MAG: DUF4124 domain-containing protein [Pseudomonadota bacterium]|nr:DUF4124 domain-containing protein [Pseudomonadota bacterium]
MLRSAALLCLFLFILAAPARAQTEIHHCIGANGGAVFTDQPCATLQATPVVDGAPKTSTTPLSTPPPTLCAASPEALRQSVIDAFAARNANRMAGLMLWNGYNSSAVIADIRSLNHLMKQSLLDVDIPDGDATLEDAAAAPDPADAGADPFASSPPAASSPARSDGDELVLHTAGNDGSGIPHERRFGVVHRAGCLWLRRLN